MLDRCVLWLEVPRYVLSNIYWEWLQVASGRVLCVGGMYICGSLSDGVI